MLGKLLKTKIGIAILSVGFILICSTIVLGVVIANKPVHIDDDLVALSAAWPKSFMASDYVEPEFIDDENRTNNAFNVSDFGEQGNNGWFYRYGSSMDPTSSRRMESFDGEKYFQLGKSGMEIKSNFIHTAENVCPILEWRAAKDGQVNISLTYVKNVNQDKNPSYPDGVTIYVYQGDNIIKKCDVDISTEKEIVVEENIENISVKKLESLYYVIDPNMNNAYDGGSLYVAIQDTKSKGPSVLKNQNRPTNDANLIDDFGAQGNNGWTYRCGKSAASSKLVSTEQNEEFINFTSPNLVISKNFIHPAINDKAILAWQPARNGDVEVRGKYTKFEQNDGNPNWPDGVVISVYKNNEKLFEKKVSAPAHGENTIHFRQSKLNVTESDNLYFVVDAGKNNSYDGGCFDIDIIDRSEAYNENDVVVDDSETRQNFADIKYDFGEQGKNGWFYQDGYLDEPFDAVNMTPYDSEEERYFDASYLEIKRDYVNPGKGKSAVIKWKVAQTGDIKIEASYTKHKNEDKNPSWPDGTTVTLYHNNVILRQEKFEANKTKEITKRLDVESLYVQKDDFITMVVNANDNNAYDGANYEFAIKGLSPLVGETEKNVVAFDGKRANNASIIEDFGKQGNNGWCLQSGYYLKHDFAVNLESYVENEKYTTIDGVEIKRDYIMPANKGRSAIVKWIVAMDGPIDIFADYTKLKNEDKNPSWPDGVTVYLMHNDRILKQEDFEPLTDKEQTKDLSVEGLWVKAGDAITLMVDGRENTAYDGGNYSFVIEDGVYNTMNMVNNSGRNAANLKLDFGEQGSNGWYYTEGRRIDKFEMLSQKTVDGSGYISRRQKNLEMKGDFVQPRLNSNAMYKWVVAEDGEINITGAYDKFGNEDPNMDYPDGTTIRIYKNDSKLYDEICTCPRGEKNTTSKSIDIKRLGVRKGDIFTFEIGCHKNNAWDGGRLDIDISDSNEIKPSIGEELRSNNTCLSAITSMKQGTDGWWFLEGTNPSDAKVLTYMNSDETAYISTTNDGLEMKKDYVHPGKDKAAIYQWVAYDSGKIDIIGSYVKYGQNDANPSYPDGVKISVFHNNELCFTEDVEAFAGDGNDNKIDFLCNNMEVVAGDIISFVIDAKGNNAYDAGKLSVNIYEVKEPNPEDADEERANNTTLFDAFGEQGADGWYYGICDWDGKNFELLDYDAENNRYYNAGKPELKADFVEPGNGKNAAYRWIVAKTGKIRVEGKYTKFANSADPEANGVCMRIFVNEEEKKWIGGETQGNFDNDVVKEFDEIYIVHQGDAITFAIDPDGNDSYDGGRLEVSITDLNEGESDDSDAEDEDDSDEIED